MPVRSSPGSSLLDSAAGRLAFQSRDIEPVAPVDPGRHEHVAGIGQERLEGHRYRAACEVLSRQEPLHHFGRFARVRRTNCVNEAAGGTDVTSRLLEKGSLRHGQAFTVATLFLPTRLGLAPDDAGARAWSVEQHPVEMLFC